MDNTTGLFKNIKESQIHKIKNEFDTSKKCMEDAINELSNLSEEIKKLQHQNTEKEFLGGAEKIQKKIDEAIKYISREGLSPH